VAVAPDYHGFVPQLAPGEVTVEAAPVSLALVALAMLVGGGWAAAVPYFGPSFGFSADGRAAWVWDVQHAVLALVPGAVAVAAALMILGRLPLLRRGMGTAGIGWAGALAVLAGAWLVVAPSASAAVLGSPYFVAASPFRAVVGPLGYALGPGLLVVACGGFAAGWSLRQRRVRARLAAVGPFVPAPRPTVAVPGATSGEAGRVTAPTGSVAVPAPTVAPEQAAPGGLERTWGRREQPPA
jgi:hypothetical protein